VGLPRVNSTLGQCRGVPRGRNPEVGFPHLNRLLDSSRCKPQLTRGGDQNVTICHPSADIPSKPKITRGFNPTLVTKRSASGDRQTSWVYSTTCVQYLYISRYLSDNKPVLSYLLLCLLPQCYISAKIIFKQNVSLFRHQDILFLSFLTLQNILVKFYHSLVKKTGWCGPKKFTRRHSAPETLTE
jgi:hypothetical protein